MRILLIGLALLSGAAIGAFATEAFERNCDFDQAAWQAASRGNETARHQALKDNVDALVHCRRLDRLDRRAVRALLGPPSPRTAGDPPGAWFYDVGVPEGHSDWPPLDVRFDGDRVVRASVPGYVEP